jgi:DNA-binding transcriptional regulator YdaS (Cro superfamily)
MSVTPAVDRSSAALDAVVRVFGSQRALAEALGITRGSVTQWRQRIPLDRCLEIENATRRLAAEREDASLIVTCKDMRPDVQWPPSLLETTAEHG